MAHYVKNADLLAEIIKSKEQNKLTPLAVQMLYKIVKGLSRLHNYKYPQDLEDCIQSGMEQVTMYWRNFDPNKSTNAFAYFTQVLKIGSTRGFNELRVLKESERVSLSEDGGIFNL